MASKVKVRSRVKAKGLAALKLKRVTNRVKLKG